MKIFLSWSGIRSHYIALTLNEWFEQVIQAAEPWVSSDISKGKRWDGEIADKLEQSKVGIICLTKDNLDSSWIHFEAGAISKTPDAYVCTFLFDVTPANVKEPLSLFQATLFTKDDVFKLLRTINSLLEKPLKESGLEGIFNTFWPQLEEKLKATPAEKVKTDVRSDRELIEETLQIVRTLKDSSGQRNIIQTNAIHNRDEILKEVWLQYSTEKNYSLTEMQDMRKINDFRQCAAAKGVSVGPPPVVRQFFQKLLIEQNQTIE